MNAKMRKLLATPILLVLSSCAEPDKDREDSLMDANERGRISIDLDAGISWGDLVDKANPRKIEVKTSKIPRRKDQDNLEYLEFYPLDPSGIGDVHAHIGIPEAKCTFDHEQILSFFNGRKFYADSKPHEPIENQDHAYLFWIDTEKDDLFIATEGVFTAGVMFWSDTRMNDIIEKNIKCDMRG